MLRSPEPPALPVLIWRARAPWSALGVRREPVLLGDVDRPLAACFSARLAHGRSAALDVSMSSAMLCCIKSAGRNRILNFKFRISNLKVLAVEFLQCDDAGLA